MKSILNKYFIPELKDKKGQGMVEYALIIGSVALVVFATLLLLGPAVTAKLHEAVDAFNI